MSATSRVSSLQTYTLVLHKGALHPEFFRVEGRRRIAHGPYEFEAWLFRGGHSIRFEHAGQSATETVSTDIAHLPTRGHVVTLPCAGERDHESELPGGLSYVTSIQTETLAGHLYTSTYNELLTHGRDPQNLLLSWSAEGEPSNLSLVEFQRYADEVHVQSYHLRSDCGLVLRTQTIFTLGTA